MYPLAYFLANCFVLFSISLCAENGGRIDLSKQEGFFEGDIDISASGRNGILAAARWTSAIIPYEFWGKDISQENKDMVAGAMKEIEGHSCIRFRPRTNEVNYTTIYKGRGCSSPVGMIGGRQDVSLADPGCWYHGTIVHELLHAVGLWHEQSRYDRDNYIIVNRENVQPYSAFNFDIQSQNVSSTYGVPYSFDSVMHYDQFAFSKNGEVTMETIDPNMQDRIGNNAYGVDADYEKVRRIYQCAGTYPTMPTPTAAPPRPCKDRSDPDYCAGYKNNCVTADWMKDDCRKTCGFCTADCKDEVNYCRDYKKQCGSLDWLKTYCRKTCKICTPY